MKNVSLPYAARLHIYLFIFLSWAGNLKHKDLMGQVVSSQAYMDDQNDNNNNPEEPTAEEEQCAGDASEEEDREMG